MFKLVRGTGVRVQLLRTYLLLQRAWFDPQHPHCGSHQSVAAVPGYLMPFADLHRCQPHTWRTYVHPGKSPIHIKSKLETKVIKKEMVWANMKLVVEQLIKGNSKGSKVVLESSLKLQNVLSGHVPCGLPFPVSCHVCSPVRGLLLQDFP